MAGNKTNIPELRGVLFPLEAPDHLSAIEVLADRLSDGLLPQDAARLPALILARETLASTYLGYDSSLPHARMPDPVPFVFAVGYNPGGIPWGGGDQRARLICLTVVPSSRATDYLGFVRRLAQLLRNEERRNLLFACQDALAFEQVLRQGLFDERL